MNFGANCTLLWMTPLHAVDLHIIQPKPAPVSSATTDLDTAVLGGSADGTLRMNHEPQSFPPVHFQF